MADFDGYEFEQETTQRLVEALRELPGAQVNTAIMHPAPLGNWQIDAEIEVSVGGRTSVLLVEIKKSVYPRDAKQVLWQLEHYMVSGDSEHKKQLVPLLAAESISPGAKDLLKSESCGFFDTGGSLFIPARDAYVYIEKPPPKTLQKSVSGLFRGKRSQILHALLVRCNEWFGVKELSELAKVSPATVSETLKALERFEWLSIKGQGPSKYRRLTDPGALLNEWKKQTLASRRQNYRRFYVPSHEPEAIAHRLAETCEQLDLDYILTEQFAAQVYTPYLTSVSRVTCRLPYGRRVNDLYADLGARPVHEGANLDVIETRSSGEFLFKEQVENLWLGSPVQVYLDLLRSGGRGKEMAEHLRQERIGF